MATDALRPPFLVLPAPALSSSLPFSVPLIPPQLHQTNSLRPCRTADRPLARALHTEWPLQHYSQTIFGVTIWWGRFLAIHSVLRHLLHPLGFWHCHRHNTFNNTIPISSLEDAFYILKLSNCRSSIPTITLTFPCPHSKSSIQGRAFFS